LVFPSGIWIISFQKYIFIRFSKNEFPKFHVDLRTSIS
jgi:hypothetical protein